MTTSATEPPSPEPSAAGRPDTPAPRVPRQPRERDRSGRNAQPAPAPQDAPSAPEPRTRRRPAPGSTTGTVGEPGAGNRPAPSERQRGKEPQPQPAPPARRESEPLAPVPPEQVGYGFWAFADRQVTLLREVSRDTGDTFRFILVVAAVLGALVAAVVVTGLVLHNVPLASAGGAGAVLFGGWGMLRTARANRRRRGQDDVPARPRAPRNNRSRRGR
ncbi:hypothetical protein ACFV1L_00235 [Kitasatospora sp. NPDC059646]|uniref:hypothetical protein n=1 Tax=Kitasatospora sp. NPDC059646 TaxID=3346893 RepID=UPI0036C8B6FE